MIVGIDLGTSTSEIAILQGDKPYVIENPTGGRITPSAVYIDNTGEVVVGDRARELNVLEPENSCIEIKRLMGYDKKVNIRGESYTPENISAFILKHLIEYAQAFTGETIDRVVVTVPAYFNETQRRATLEAGKLAGLKVERLINEPTAAALAYGIEHMEENNHILVYDPGGGTLDVTVLEMFDGVLEVKASSGNNQLGGKDFDQLIVNRLISRFMEDTGVNLQNDVTSMAKLKHEAELCKMALSHTEAYEIILPFIAEKKGSPLTLRYTVTRNEFEKEIEPLIQSTAECLEVALKDAGLTTSEIDFILLVGGSTRIPYVRNFLKKYFGQEPTSLLDPDLSVVMGAAVQAGILDNVLSKETDILITDVCPYTLGIKCITNIGGFEIPDYFSVIINRNLTIPVTKTKRYYTASDEQTAVEICIYQGNHKHAKMNHCLGTFTITGIPPANAGKESIDVAFTYDVNGLLSVEARISSTGKKAEMTIDTAGSTMEQEVDVENWKDKKAARPYRALIRRAERLIDNLPDGPEKFQLEVLVFDLKTALVKEKEDSILKQKEEDLMELLELVEETRDEH